MIQILKRLFTKWYRIPRLKVPKWVRGELYKRKFVIDGNREYKKIVIKKSKKIYYWFGVDHDNGGELLNEDTKIWKKQKFYYRNIK